MKYRLTENKLRSMIREAVKNIIFEYKINSNIDQNTADALLDELGNICYLESQNNKDFKVRTLINRGDFYLVFQNQSLYAHPQHTKDYAKDFIRRNKIFTYGVLDIDGYDANEDLWVRLIPNDDVELRGIEFPHKNELQPQREEPNKSYTVKKDENGEEERQKRASRITQPSAEKRSQIDSMWNNYQGFPNKDKEMEDGFNKIYNNYYRKPDMNSKRSERRFRWNSEN